MKKFSRIISICCVFLFAACFFVGCKTVTKKEKKGDEIEYEKYTDTSFVDLPVVQVVGDMSKISKENKVPVTILYEDANQQFEQTATIKYQGATSMMYSKKNFNIQFMDGESKKKIKLVDEWGKQSKYCLKANYVDFSSSRNIVSARVFGEIVHSRNIDDEVNALVNGGAIDGYPVKLFINGDYAGIYTMNIPRDKWMFDMDKTGQKAIILDDEITTATGFLNKIPENFAGWDVEFCSTEDTTGIDWIRTSFNSFIDFVNESTDEEFVENIGNYTTLDRVIDYMLFVLFINGKDNLSRNTLYVTYDGQHWIPSAYDLDGTWGAAWNGFIESENYYLKLADLPSRNLLWKRVIENFGAQVKARYFELRESVLSYDNVTSMFEEFLNEIPEYLLEIERELYVFRQNTNLNHLEQIKNFVQRNGARLDAEFEAFE